MFGIFVQVFGIFVQVFGVFVQVFGIFVQVFGIFVQVFGIFQTRQFLSSAIATTLPSSLSTSPLKNNLIQEIADFSNFYWICAKANL